MKHITCSHMLPFLPSNSGIVEPHIQFDMVLLQFQQAMEISYLNKDADAFLLLLQHPSTLDIVVSATGSSFVLACPLPAAKRISASAACVTLCIGSTVTMS